MNPKFQKSFTKNRQHYNKHKGSNGKFKKNHFERKEKLGETIDNEIAELKTQYESIVPANIQKFTDFPLCQRTLNGLKLSKYTAPTEIQRESIGLTLQGHDILGAAKTGSGKTLAFLIPILECLYRLKWSSLDGMGALIISPTRELAYQTFEVLRKIGKSHDFSAGLVIGGKNMKEESERINQTNIVICTPGRLLQHMDETVNFTADSLQMLVLDEADRILDLGFAQTMNAIIQNLPSERQTLLFSATQTKSVKDLARLSLADPMYVSVHEHSQHSTPARLTQSYIVCELNDKLNMLWSFIKNHLKSKVLVFLSCCKEVKYIYEAFKRMRPGATILSLHGAMNQLRRVEVYNSFCRKQNAVLFATDIAARGLDFPAVNWVLQLDCPEDANTYIHRAGRTARYEEDGEALLVLMPSEEEAMVKQLVEKKIPINKIRVNNKKLSSIQSKLESQCAADPALKDSAQRAFVSYLRGVFLMSNKAVFDVKKLNMDMFARSLGLAVVPRVRFLQRDEKRRQERRAEQQQEKDEKSMQVLLRATRDADHKSKPETDDSEKKISFEEENSTNGEASSEDDEENSSDDEEEDLMQLIKNKFGKSSKQKSKEDNSVLKSNKRTSEAASPSDDDDDDDDDELSEEEEEGDSSESDSGEDTSEGDDSDSASDSDSVLDERTKAAKTKAIKSKLKGGVSESSESVGFRFDVDDDDDLFKVKRRTDLEESSDEEIEKSRKEILIKKKPVSKVKEAKKLLKKNIQLNTKVKFDDTGEEVSDIYKKPQVKKTFEDDEDLGGINIAEARQRLQEEDKFDKELHRQKVKQKHKEQRYKKKEEMRKKRGEAEEMEEDEVEVTLDTETGDSPLDYVPDPDKIYGPSGSMEESDEEEGPSQAKRRRDDSSDESDESGDGSDGDDGGDSDDSSDDAGDGKLGVEETIDMDEEMALRLLQGSV